MTGRDRRLDLKRLRQIVLAVATAALLATAPAYANTPVPVGQLQLASPNAIRTYGQPTSIVGTCTASAQAFATPASLSADAHGNGLLTIGTQTLGNQPHAVSEISPSQLELSFSGSGGPPGPTYTASSTFTGYGTSFSGTYVLTVPSDGSPCTVTRPQILTLQGSGLTLGASSGPVTLADACSDFEAELQKQLQELLNDQVRNLKANIQIPGPGDLNVAFDGGGSSGSAISAPLPAGATASSAPSGCSVSFLAFDGSGGAGSSISAPLRARAAVASRAALAKGAGKKTGLTKTVLMAQLKRHFNKRGTYKVTLHINKAGHKLLARLAAADRAYFNANPGGTSPPKAHFRITLRFKRSG